MKVKSFQKNTHLIILAFLLSFIIMSLGHVVVFALAVYIFHLDLWAIHGLKWFLMAMPANIVLSSFLIHKKDHLLIRWYYIFSMVWIGWFFNFLLFITPLAALKLVWRFQNHFFDASHYAWLLLILSTLFTILNIAYAFYPKIRRLAVKIKDLPDYWENKTLVLISDVHIGPVYRQRFLNRAIDRINQLNPSVVLIGGDLFDGMEADFFWLHEPFKRLSAPQGVYYAIGNHDLYLGLKNVFEIFRESDIRVLNNERIVRKGLQFIGINYFKQDSLSLEKIILSRVGYDAKMPSVLLWHEPKRIAQAKAAGIDLMLAGHTHNGQMWPLNFIAKWVYKGYNYGLYQDHDFSLYVSCGLGTWGPPLRNTSRSEIVAIRLEKK
ncbi:MAG: metallophosphoesterase [Patescibacteria group bacterium]